MCQPSMLYILVQLMTIQLYSVHTLNYAHHFEISTDAQPTVVTSYEVMPMM